MVYGVKRCTEIEGNDGGGFARVRGEENTVKNVKNGCFGAMVAAICCRSLSSVIPTMKHTKYSHLDSRGTALFRGAAKSPCKSLEIPLQGPRNFADREKLYRS